jgi:anti-sigma B factor antagonist
MNPSFSLDVSRSGEVSVARLAGDVDLANVGEIEARLADGAGGTGAMVIDLGRVSYMDSTGFGMLERLSAARPLQVVLPPGALVHRAFAVTGLAQLVPVFDTVEDALKAR